MGSESFDLIVDILVMPLNGLCVSYQTLCFKL